MMRIVVPTRGRWDMKLTSDILPKSWRDRIDIVCPEKEAVRHTDYRSWAHVVVQPDPDMTIAAKRAWIMKTWSSEKIVMMDDDLMTWSMKREDNPAKLRMAKTEDVEAALAELEKIISPETPHAGFGTRLMNNRRPPGWHVGRMQYVLGYHLPTIRKHCELGRIETREDMDYTLQLLRKGFPCAVSNDCCVEQKSYGSKGGCYGQRTTEASDSDARKLAELHPGYVRVVQKEYKNHPRLEVVCQWGRALADGQERLKSEPSRDQGVSGGGKGKSRSGTLPKAGRTGRAKSAARSK